MADTHVHEPKTEDVVLKAKDFWSQYQKPLLALLIAVVVVIGGWFAYKNYIVAPKEAEAENAIWKAEQYFRQDSLILHLNEENLTRGFLNLSITTVQPRPVTLLNTTQEPAI